MAREVDALIDRLDKRYCHPAIAAAVDPDVELALSHIEAIHDAVELESNARDEAESRYQRLLMMIEDVAAEISNQGHFDNTLEAEHAADLRRYAAELHRCIREHGDEQVSAL